jgi:DNA processing protein
MEYPIRTLSHDEFPQLLREIPDKPKQLSIRGTMPSPDYTYLCIVGSRRTTLYGQRILHKLIAGLARYPIAIVSGMAWGTDTNAHKAAMDVGLPTIVVLPSGLNDNVMYPRMNRPLAKQILKSGGALLSENPDDFVAMLHSFAQRNRIAAGISKASLIIEAGEASGTLITARLALDYNREVLVVPHEIGHETGVGCNTLIHQGATLVRDSNDILEALGFKLEGPTQTTLPLPADLTSVEAAVLSVLDGALERDEIIAESGLSAQEANVALSSLLIRGLINERLGKIERV